MLLSLFLL